jgi:hypothetical protein
MEHSAAVYSVISLFLVNETVKGKRFVLFHVHELTIQNIKLYSKTP